MTLAPPTFIDTAIQPILDDLAQKYESLTGKVIHPAQVEQLLFNAFSYREGLVREAIQEAAEQNLVAFSRAPILDYLGELVGVKRLDAFPASCTIEFTLTANISGVSVPKGTRIASADGLISFATDDVLNIAATVLTGTITATCETLGAAGNGYSAGLIKTILDPLSFVADVVNTNSTAGGSEKESDDNLRERIKLAPSSFSNAGSKGAYIYWAKSASPDIIDVAVTSPMPGHVNIYPLMSDGSVTPTQVLDAVEAACNDTKVRPLTDVVTVFAPTKVEYEIVANVTLYDDADQAVVEAAILANLQQFTMKTRMKMGIDIMLSQVKKECVVNGVYDVDLEDGASSPFVNIIIAETEFALCTNITITTIGTTAG